MDKIDTLASPGRDVSELEDGQEINEVNGWCDLCHWAFGGSMTIRAAIHLQGKFYHPTCYPKAVTIYLATQKLKKMKEEKDA